MDNASNAESVKSETYAMPMVSIPAGCFDMGDNFAEGSAEELPVHNVCLDAYLIDKYEVTQAEYQAQIGSNSSFFSTCTDCPVERVTWTEADAYCTTVGKRLPTEAEREYAARAGGQVVRYGTGTDTVDTTKADYSNILAKTVAVGSYSANSLGLYDMSGNVWEWVNDWYDANYYSSSPTSNPTGPASGSFRVLRGGSWIHFPTDLRASIRGSLTPDARYYYSGFRCSQ